MIEWLYVYHRDSPISNLFLCSRTNLYPFYYVCTFSKDIVLFSFYNIFHYITMQLLRNNIICYVERMQCIV